MGHTSAKLTGVGMLLCLVMAGGTSEGASLTIAADAVCTDDGSVVINYTATSWSTGNPSAENPLIQILVNGMVVDSGAFTPGVYSFSGTVPAPVSAGPLDEVTVTGFAAADWDCCFMGGQSDSVTVIIPEDPCTQPGLGRFTGGGHQLRVDGVRVTRGLTIHCDLVLSNNLEVNWQGNQFHMTEHMLTVACTDDPDIIQAPPDAPLDTLVGVGTGRYNGNDGYTIQFTLVDAGEPGRQDMMRILITEDASPVPAVLDIPLQLISGGNLQAHFDQPHK